MCWKIWCASWFTDGCLLAVCSHGKKVEVWSLLDFSGGSDSKASAYNAGDLGSIPGSGRSPGEGNGTPGRRSLVGYSPRGLKESDMAEQLHFHFTFTSGGQMIGASAPVLSMNTQGLFPLQLTGLISLQSRGLSRAFSSTTLRKHQSFCTQPSLWSNSSHLTRLLEKP